MIRFFEFSSLTGSGVLIQEDFVHIERDLEVLIDLYNVIVKKQIVDEDDIYMKTVVSVFNC